MHGNNTRNVPVELFLSQTSKNAMFFLLSFMCFVLQNQRTGGQNRFCPEAGGGGSWQWGRQEVPKKRVGE
jgi:hypothetical protein